MADIPAGKQATCSGTHNRKSECEMQLAQQVNSLETSKRGAFGWNLLVAEARLWQA